MLNMNKIMPLIILIMSTMITISANNWLGMWMGLEMNLMAFIPLIYEHKNKNSSQSMMIYFLAQSLSSILLLFSVLINSYIMTSSMLINELTNMMLMISLFIKMGTAPFHMWLPEMMSNMNWYKCLTLMTWQKIAPLFVLSCTQTQHWMMMLSVMMSTMIGAIGGLNQTSIRKIMAYSSISHMGWMMMLLSLKPFWYKYLAIYSMIIIMLITILNYNNTYFMNQMSLSSKTITEKYTISALMMSMGGLPPFLGFLPKWMTIQAMIESNLMFTLMVMMMSSLITLFYYLRLVSSMLLSFSTVSKWIFKHNMNQSMMIAMIMMNLMLPSCSMMIFF
uniref:NADH-ubiquinone oxidoreductase chain 2 n=1 Tax=Neolethaeus assamensis TaxID=1589711 RepID=A0A343ISG5_9HEMI|nr:NADH dehydrogenase subunit 2 [Neolethaeus assamensis]AST10190.1 NADH dehydrogenase subunit 2 [Neolethaeus assamensis]